MHPSQDKHSINCSSLKHRAKLHFIDRHYVMKPLFQHPFHHLHSMLKKFHSSIAAGVPHVTFPLKIGTTIHKAHSIGITSPFMALWHISVITWIPTPPLAAINSNDTSEGPRAFPDFISFNACSTSPPTYTNYWTFYCIPFNIMIPIIFFIHDHFHIILLDLPLPFSLKHSFPTLPLIHLQPHYYKSSILLLA